MAKKFTRDVNGCLTCKRRKKKCDTLKPKCSACTRLRLPCEYREKFVWEIHKLEKDGVTTKVTLQGLSLNDCRPDSKIHPVESVIVPQNIDKDNLQPDFNHKPKTYDDQLFSNFDGAHIKHDNLNHNLLQPNAHQSSNNVTDNHQPLFLQRPIDDPLLHNQLHMHSNLPINSNDSGQSSLIEPKDNTNPWTAWIPEDLQYNLFADHKDEERFWESH